MTVEPQESVEERTPNCFVERVVAADVFAENNHFAVEREDCGRVDTTGPGEIRLGVAERFRQREQFCRFDLNTRGGIDRRKLSFSGSTMWTGRFITKCYQQDRLEGKWRAWA